jgi:sugar phosphate isomerase/epimerase
VQAAIPGFTYHIFPETQQRPRDVLGFLEPLLWDGYWQTFQILPSGDPAHARALGAELRLAGVVPTFDIGGTVSDGELNLQSPDPRTREAALGNARALVDEALALGAVVADINPGPDPGPERRPEELRLLADSLCALCDYAEEEGRKWGRTGDSALTISLEHFDRDLDKRRILGPTAETAGFVDDLRRRVPNIGMTMDLSHLILLGEDPYDAVRTAGARVTNAHLSNCILGNRTDPRWGDRHPPFFVSGSAVDEKVIAAFVAGLREIGYFSQESGNPGTLTFQVKPAPTEDSLKVAAACRRILEDALARFP